MSALSMAGTVRRGTFAVDARLEVADGEVVAVLGPNGAGKTTLLRALAGLTPLSTGHIRLGDAVLDDGRRAVEAQRRPVGYVFQNYRLFPHLSVLDNVAFGPRWRGRRSRADARDAARDWLARLDLLALAPLKPPALSGGQSQRVALARALAARPQLLLLDEPFAALDARTKSEVRGELRSHLREFGGPAVLVTHDPLEAMVLADRLVVIEAGRVVQSGLPADVAQRPASDYVARLMGLNLYRGDTTADGVVSVLGGGTLVGTPTDTGPVLVSVRPNAISVHTEHPDHVSTRNRWPGTVTALELLHDRVRVAVEGTPGALVDVTPSAVAELGLVEGSRVWLSAKATDLEVYPDPGR